MTEQRVVDVPDRFCFEIFDGDDLAGFAEYRRSEGRITFTHTEIDSSFAGRGLGGVLARGALDSVREQGLDVLPLCPFIRGWIFRHPEYADLIPQDQRQRFAE